MPRTATILPLETNRAPFVAQAILCVMGVACAGFMAFALVERERSGESQGSNAAMDRAEAEMLKSIGPRTQGPGTAPPQVFAPQFPPGAFSNSAATPTPPPLPPPGAAQGRTSSSGAAVKPSRPKPSLPADKQLKNPQAMEAVMAARAMRDQGDMQAAIEQLKSADVREPNHPEILGEMALTFEDMGIASRAEPLWRQIYTMGEANAGGYYTLASEKIGGGDTKPAAANSPTSASPVSLGACRLSREPLPKQGERISIHVPVLGAPGMSIDPTKIEIHVTLFESVNGGARIEAVPQDKTAQSWSTPPVNWKDPSGETVDVSYDLYSPRQGSTDTRTFHGYTVKLYYQNKLAGEQDQPESLRSGAEKKTTGPGVDNALFPK